MSSPEIIPTNAQLVIIGAGPGGYAAAFKAVELGCNVTLIDPEANPGGVCLHRGCIPSKALLHVAKLVAEAEEAAEIGISFAQPKIDLERVREWKDEVIGKLTGGLGGKVAKQKITYVCGMAKFKDEQTLTVTTTAGAIGEMTFAHAILATGSRPIMLPGVAAGSHKIVDSTGALELLDVPRSLLVVGGGYIGLELGSVYAALGSKVSVVEMTDGLLPGCDRDLVRPLERRVKKRYENIWLNAKVTDIKALKNGLKVSFEGKNVPETDTFDRVLLAVGRSPNGKLIDADKAGVVVDERGFISVDKQQRTNVNHIFAIGDIVGQPMLAHKATHEAKTAAEVISGMKSYFDAKAIPSVAYTDPEISWMGLTEEQAKADGVEYTKGVFPWAASGRSLSIGRNEGITKLLFDKNTHKIIGAGMVGTNAGELIAEAVLALEMGADIEDIALTVHPHPTLSETFNFAAEMAEGTITDLYIPKK